MKKILIAFLLTIIAFVEVSAKMEQTGYRWRFDDGNEITATWMADEGQPVSYSGTEAIRLRLQTRSTFEGAVFNQSISLYYSAGTFGSEWRLINMDPSNAFVLFNTPNVSDLAPTSRQLSPRSETFQPGVFFGSTVTHQVEMPEMFYSEYEWAIRPTGSAASNVYFFAWGYEISGGTVIEPEEPEAAKLFYSTTPFVPIKKWSIYFTLVLLAGFVLIRYRKLL